MSEKAAPRWERKADERPASLYKAALKSFCENGFRATKLEDVAEQAGVSKGTIYRYFKGKDDLLLQSIDHVRQAYRKELDEFLTTLDGSHEKRLRAILIRVWELFQQPRWGRMQLLLYGEVANEFPDFFKEFSRDTPHKLLHVLVVEIEAGVRTGEFRSGIDVGVAARSMLAALSHLALTRIHLGLEHSDPCARERVFTGCVDLFLHGLCAVEAK